MVILELKNDQLTIENKETFIIKKEGEDYVLFKKGENVLIQLKKGKLKEIVKDFLDFVEENIESFEDLFVEIIYYLKRRLTEKLLEIDPSKLERMMEIVDLLDYEKIKKKVNINIGDIIKITKFADNWKIEFQDNFEDKILEYISSQEGNKEEKDNKEEPKEENNKDKEEKKEEVKLLNKEDPLISTLKILLTQLKESTEFFDVYKKETIIFKNGERKVKIEFLYKLEKVTFIH